MAGVLGEAAALEKEYDWMGAEDLYRQALSAVDEGGCFRRGEIQEKIGYSLRRAAFQAESHEEFREKMMLTVEAYEKAYGFYEILAAALGLGDEVTYEDITHALADDRTIDAALLISIDKGVIRDKQNGTGVSNVSSNPATFCGPAVRDRSSVRLTYGNG